MDAGANVLNFPDSHFDQMHWHKQIFLGRRTSSVVRFYVNGAAHSKHVIQLDQQVQQCNRSIVSKLRATERFFIARWPALLPFYCGRRHQRHAADKYLSITE